MLIYIYNKFVMINIQERELNLDDFIKSMFNIGLCSGTYELISFKLGVMIDMTNFTF